MPGNTTTPAAGVSRASRLEAIEHRVYRLQHVAQFIADVAAAAGPNAAANHVLAESVLVTMGIFAEDLLLVRESLNREIEEALSC